MSQALIFIFGLIIGSFLGMLSFRLPKGLSLSGRSICDNCKKNINWTDNIPVFSYLFLRAKCKYCRKGISFRYPIIEISTGVGFLIAYKMYQSPGSALLIKLLEDFAVFVLVFVFLLTVLFILLAVIDIEHQILPDILVGILGMVIITYLFFSDNLYLYNYLLSGFLSFTFFLLIYLFTRGQGMGFGDVKLSLVLGFLFLPKELLSWVVLSFFSGSATGLLLLLFGKANFGKKIPFGPFLLFSAFAVFLLGDKVLDLYFSLFKIIP